MVNILHNVKAFGNSVRAIGLSTLAWTGALSAQPITDIDLQPNPAGDSLRVLVRPNGASFNQIVSGLTFTIRWEAASNATLGTRTQFCSTAFSIAASPDGEVDNGGFTYLTYNAFGTASLVAECTPPGWTANAWNLIMRVKVNSINQCTNFNIVNDGYTAATNKNFFISLNGPERTGIIEPTVAQLGCNLDCLGVPGGTALPGSPCNDNNVCTINDVYTGTAPSCGCAGTVQDTDGDGTCNANDGCPNDPLKIAAGICGCGVADTDSDSDGTANCNDGCPNDPLKIAPGSCGCGVADTDTDGDGVPNCIDTCPLVSGQIGSACNDNNAATINDKLNSSCICQGTCGSNPVQITLQTDANGNQTSWEIIPLGGGAALCNGSGLPSSTTVVGDCCLPSGCYQLRVLDSFGDGMTTGGYVLRDAANQRIIDNANDGVFTFTSTVAAGFCVPLSTDGLQAGSCDQTVYINAVLYAIPNSAVSAQFGTVNQTDDGYQYWFFDPDGSYGRTIFKSHANPGSPGTPAGATACASILLSSMVTNPLPLNKLLNVRIRSRVNGVYGQYGPACRLTVTNPTGSCTTQLVPTAGSTFSCGATGKVVGASGNTGMIHATSVSGANKYQFEFVLPGTAYTRTIASATTALTLSAWATKPLVCGTRIYNVRVHASLDNGTTYCNYGPVCTVSIANNTAGCTPYAPAFDGGGTQSAGQEGSTMNLFPNPVQEGAVTLELTGLSPEVSEVSFEVFDLFGRTVVAQVLAKDGAEEINTRFDLPKETASGIYLVNVAAGDVRYTERLMVE